LSITCEGSILKDAYGLRLANSMKKSEEKFTAVGEISVRIISDQLERFIEHVCW
jgi:hypothetical protein